MDVLSFRFETIGVAGSVRRCCVQETLMLEGDDLARRVGILSGKWRDVCGK